MHIVKFVSRTLLALIVATPTLSNELFIKLKEMLLSNGASGSGASALDIDKESVMNDFFLSLQHLINNKIHDVWYMMAKYLLDYQTEHECKLINSDFVSMQMPRVFRNLMSHKDVNFLRKKWFSIVLLRYFINVNIFSFRIIRHANG